MIVLRTDSSPFFDTAYFLLRASVRERETDILAEANRIVEGYREEAPPLHRSGRVRSFLLGALCGSLIALLALGVPFLITLLSRGWIF